MSASKFGYVKRSIQSWLRFAKKNKIFLCRAKAIFKSIAIKKVKNIVKAGQYFFSTLLSKRKYK